MIRVIIVSEIAATRVLPTAALVYTDAARCSLVYDIWSFADWLDILATSPRLSTLCSFREPQVPPDCVATLECCATFRRLPCVKRQSVQHTSPCGWCLHSGSPSDTACHEQVQPDRAC